MKNGPSVNVEDASHYGFSPEEWIALPKNKRYYLRHQEEISYQRSAFRKEHPEVHREYKLRSHLKKFGYPRGSKKHAPKLGTAKAMRERLLRPELNPVNKPEVREKIRQFMLQYVSTEEGRQSCVNHLPKDVRGDKNPFYGRKHSDETKRKISESRIGRFTLERASTWKGGRSWVKHGPEFSSKVKMAVKNRDCGCRVCGRTTGKLDVHHLNDDKHDCSVDNLLTLCARCHGKTSRNKAWLPKHLQSL